MYDNSSVCIYYMRYLTRAGIYIQVYGCVGRAIQDGEESYIALARFLYSFRCEAIQLCEVTSIRLLLRVGIKVADEWQKSVDYVRGSNIYVRGYLDLRVWSLNLRAQIWKNHYVKALFFFTRRTIFPPLDKRNTREGTKGLLVTSERYIGELGVRCLSTLNRGQDLRQQSQQWYEV